MSAVQTGNTSATGQAPSAPTSLASLAISPLTVSPPLPKHSQARYDIPILDGAGKDYTHWKLHARLVFAARGLWGVINGSDPEPNATTDTANYTEWMAKDREAWIQIAMSVQGQCLNAILDAKNAKECWDKLATKLKGKGEGCVVYLMEGLFHGALSESEPMEPQIETFLTTGEGHVKGKLHLCVRKHHIILQDVFYVPDLHGNLLLVGQLAKNGMAVTLLDNICMLCDRQGHLLCKVKSHGNLFIMPDKNIRQSVPPSAPIGLLPA